MHHLGCERNDIKHINTAVRAPRANSRVKLANQTILHYLRSSNKNPNEWGLILRRPMD
ncbi:unnamed protein product, partial [Ceratitis capitata]